MELAVAGPKAPPWGRKGAAVGEYLDAIVVGIRHENITRGGAHRDATGEIELPGARTGPPELVQVNSRRRKLLDTVVIAIQHIDHPAGPVHRHALRVKQLPVSRPIRSYLG